MSYLPLLQATRDSRRYLNLHKHSNVQEELYAENTTPGDSAAVRELGCGTVEQHVRIVIAVQQ